FFSSRRRHTIFSRDWSSDVCSSDLRRYLIQVQTANNYFLRIRVSGGRIWLSAQNGTGAYNESNYVDLPTGVDNVEVKAYYAIRPGGEQDWLYFRVGDIVQGPIRVPDLGAGNTAYSSTMGLILVNNDVGFNDLWYTFRNTNRIYLTEELGQRWSGEAPQASYAASLDKGLQDVTALPSRDGHDAWEVSQDVVGAESGSAVWDEKGIFRFWNAHRIRELQTKVVRRLTLDEVSGLQVTNSLDSVRNIWSVDAGRKKAVYGTVYESRDPDEFRTPAGSIRTSRVWSENVVAPDPFLVRRRSTMGSGTDYPNYQWDDE